MAVIEQRLQGLTDAEFGKAEKQYRIASTLQAVVTLLAASSVFVTDQRLSLLVAIATLAVFGLWANIDWAYKDTRLQAERGRKALWIADGLGDSLSKPERRDVEAGFHCTDEEGRAAENPEYFASKSPPGDKRLTELIEESGFYSCRLLRHSAKWAWTRLILGGAVALGLLLSAILVGSSGQTVVIARLVCTALVFFIGNEVLGAAKGYDRAVEVLSKLQARVAAIRATGYPSGDLLLLFADYNAAVEGAPMMAPGVYDRHQARLDDLWRRHLESEG